MPAKSKSVDAYLAGLPDSQRTVLELEDLPLDVIGESVARIPVDAYIRRYVSVKRK
jgi:hypothetical protein